MTHTLRQRRDLLAEARRAVADRVAARTRILRRAPDWWRPGMEPDGLPPGRRRIAERLARLLAALEEDRALLGRLDQELVLLEEHRPDLRQAEAAALAWLTEVPDERTLLEEVVRDPVNDALDADSRIDLVVARLLLRARDGAPAGGLTALDDLLTVPRVTEPVLRDLLRTGLDRLLRRPRPPQPEIGVLAPARLETRLDPPVGPSGRWTLRLRVVPDEPFLVMHDPVPTAAELDDVEALWRAVAGPGLDSERGRIAWRALASAHGPARAAWLARTFPPLPPGPDGEIRVARPPAVRTGSTTNRLAGLPDRLECWVARGGRPPVQADAWPVDAALLELQPGDPGDPGQRRWWEDFDVAVAAGLGRRIDLGTDPPGDLDAVYVVGLGPGDPQQLFADQRDGGRLAVLDLGVPTNTVDGAPAADLAADPETWLQLLLAPPGGQVAARRLAETLTGDPAGLSPVPGGETDPTEPSALLVPALWPALWGHTLKDQWGLGERVHDLGVWARGALRPEGPLPPIRIGTQPYGVLPVTTLARFRPAAGDPAIEAKLTGPLADLRRRWADLAEAAGTVDGADTERLLALLARVPTSEAFAWRHLLPLDLVLSLLWALGEPVSAEELNRVWERDAAEALRLLGEPPLRQLAVGWPQDLELPLVSPTNLRRMSLGDAMRVLLQAEPGDLTREGWLAEWFGRDGLPDSLLFRLVLFSLVVSGAEVHRAAQGPSGPVVEPVVTDDATPSALARDARAMVQGELALSNAQVLLFSAVRDAVLQLADRLDGVDPVPALERALRATLDTASHRLDTFVTGIAWRRLQRLQGMGSRHLLGLYGWVDGPLTGAPGPTAGGFLHAPSDPQALTAAILRDKAVHDPEAGRWDIDLTSSEVRTAKRIADEVRLGAHPSEVLGRLVEQVAGDPATVQALRTAFPMHTGDDGRRVCDGQQVLAADPPAVPLSPVQRAALQPLRDAVDAYGDLLVCEAVHAVVEGRTGLAGAAMDAAAGLGRPPDLDVLRTPRPGRTVHSLVLAALPPAPPPTTSASTSPGEIADPSVAAFLVSHLGDPASPAWRWQLDDGAGGVQEVTLAGLGLAPIDTVALSADALRSLVRDAAHPATAFVDSAGSTTHERARRLVEVLGSRPATTADLSDGPGDEEAERTELAARYHQLVDTGGLLHAELMAAAGAGGTEAQRQSALRRALGWGITPLTADAAGDDPAVLVARARDALADRLARAPSPGDVAAMSTADIARAVAELAAPEGRLAVLARVPLAGHGPFAAEASDPSGLPGLDAAWLSTVAAVREACARLEAHQLDAALDPGIAPLQAWTDRPGDPWQAAEPPGPDGRPLPTRLIALYGPAGALAGPDAALGVIDSWAETVPDEELPTVAAFGFDAPAARAPQALLVAVPPDEDAPLDPATLVATLAETRELLRARTVLPQHLAGWAAAFPAAMLPATGSVAVELTE